MRKITPLRMNYILLLSLFSAFLGNAQSPTEASTNSYRHSITVTSNLSAGSDIEIVAEDDSQIGAYIDLNGNKTKDEGEDLRLEMGEAAKYLIWGNKKEVTIYGGNLLRVKLENAELTSVKVEKAPALLWLEVPKNKLTSLDISSNRELVRLDCSENKSLKSVKFSNPSTLKEVYMEKCALENIDFSACSQLQRTMINENKLTSVDLSMANELSYLDISRNKIGANAMHQLIETLNANEEEGKMLILINTDPNAKEKEGNVCLKKDISLAKSKHWTPLDNYSYQEYEGSEEDAPIVVSETEKISITPSAAIAPSIKVTVYGEALWVDLNRNGQKDSNENLTSGTNSVATPTGMEAFSIYGKKITSLELNECSISKLDLSLANSLISIASKKNSTLTSVVFPNEKQALSKIELIENAIEGSVDLSEYGNLSTIVLSNNNISDLQLGAKPTLKHLDIAANKLESLNLLGCTGLEYLSMKKNNLTEVSFSATTQLKEIYAQDNKLEEADFSYCNFLEIINLENNQLTKLLLPAESSDTKIVKLSYNKLQHIDLGTFTSAIEIEAAHNELTSVSRPSSKALTSLSLSNNKLIQLDLSEVKNLQHLYISRNKLSNLNLSSVPDLLTLSIYGNELQKSLMTQFVKELPMSNNTALSDRVLIVVFMNENGEIEDSNRITTKDVDIAKQRGWNVCSINPEGMSAPYAGEPTRIAELSKEKMQIATMESGWKLSMSTEELHKAKVYSLTGELLFETQGIGELLITTPIREVFVTIEGIKQAIPLIR